MPAGNTVVLVLLFVAVDAVVIGALIAWMASTLREIPARFPYRPPLPGSVRREFQSFRIDLVNVGWGYHIEVDEVCLHLFPARFERWLGVAPASIPWGDITLVSSGRFGCTVKVRSWTIRGPAWCLELAAQRDATKEAAPQADT